MHAAAWHTAKKLELPKNKSILPLPPYSPEFLPLQVLFHLQFTKRLSAFTFVS